MMGFSDWERAGCCILCGRERIRPLPLLDHLARCAGCGHIQLDPRPTQQAIAASYDQQSGTHATWEAEEAGRRSMWRKRAARVGERLAQPGRVLDVGAGFGDFLMLLRDQGWHVDGTEVSGDAVRHAARRGLDLRHGQLENADWAPESFDLVTMWHVLEHVPWPGATLDRLHVLLKTGGLLVIGVPNDSLFPRMALLSIRDVVHRLRGRSPRAVASCWGIRAPGEEIHLSFFAPHRLARALQSRGFEAIELGLDDHYAAWSATTNRELCRNQALWRWGRLNIHRTIYLAALKG